MLKAKTEEQQEFVRSTLTDVASWVGIVNEDRVELDGWVDFDQMAKVVDYLRGDIMIIDLSTDDKAIEGAKELIFETAGTLWERIVAEQRKINDYDRLLEENRMLNDSYFKLKKEYDTLKEKTKNLPRIATLNKRIHELRQENENLVRQLSPK